MKAGVIVAVLVAAIGTYFIMLGTANSEFVSLFGLSFHPSVARGIGIVSLVVSLVVGLVAYGSSLPESTVERRQR